MAFQHFDEAVLEPSDHRHGLRDTVLRAVSGGGASLKLRGRLEEALRRLGVGLAANPTVKPEVLLIWVHGQVRM